MLYQQGPSGWYMEQSREHQVGQGQHMPRCIQRSGWHSEPRPWTSADLSGNKALQDLASMFKMHKSPPKKAETHYKAALAVQRPFLKSASEMLYSYTPQMHSTLKSKTKKNPTLHLLAREAKDLSVMPR